MSLFIGDVYVTPADCTNPYTYHGKYSWGSDRVRALQAFKAGKPLKGVILWHAPANGGAHPITAAEVNWPGSGV